MYSIYTVFKGQQGGKEENIRYIRGKRKVCLPHKGNNVIGLEGCDWWQAKGDMSGDMTDAMSEYVMAVNNDELATSASFGHSFTSQWW